MTSAKSTNWGVIYYSLCRFKKTLKKMLIKQIKFRFMSIYKEQTDGYQLGEDWGAK